jgi:hypothetical protein
VIPGGAAGTDRRPAEPMQKALGFPIEQRVHDGVIHTTRSAAMKTTDTIDTLGEKLGDAALTIFVRLCPEVRSAPAAQLDAACAAMRAKSGEVVRQLLDDSRDAPWIAHIAFQTAALTLAHEAVKVMRGARCHRKKMFEIPLGSPIEQRVHTGVATIDR